MQNVYGIVVDGIHHDVSKTERGAKNYATRNGHDNVSVRYNCGYVVDVVAVNIKGKWVESDVTLDEFVRR